MAQVGGGARGHSIAPSISSPGIAGKGAFGSYGATDTSGSGSGAAAGAATGVAVGAAAVAAGASHGLQERPKYVYGQMEPQQNQDDHPDDASEHAHGVYSSEPMAQQTYNAEAYGSYAAYDAQGAYNGGYQDATREYQGQEGYAVGGYDQGYGYENHPYGQNQQATYDAAQYAQYDQYAADPNQYAQYDHSAYVATGSAPAQGSSGRAPVSNADAYGGM